ncbi:hypothetical protein T484DRAFT_1930316 [Baffinella frigidus]|nr:hypothetical protein T484DRAFT_1930316 [Cryptophyta sp. CCMP2293]
MVKGVCRNTDAVATVAEGPPDVMLGLMVNRLPASRNTDAIASVDAQPGDAQQVSQPEIVWVDGFCGVYFLEHAAELTRRAGTRRQSLYSSWRDLARREQELMVKCVQEHGRDSDGGGGGPDAAADAQRDCQEGAGALVHAPQGLRAPRKTKRAPPRLLALPCLTLVDRLCSRWHAVLQDRSASRCRVTHHPGFQLCISLCGLLSAPKLTDLYCTPRSDPI